MLKNNSNIIFWQMSLLLLSTS